MSTFNLTRTTLRALPFLALLGTLRPVLATPTYTRPLPIANINNGANRSNFGLEQSNFGGTPFILGDDFQLSDAGISGTYNVNTFTVWEIGNTVLSSSTDPGGAPPSTEFSSITLYGGLDGTDLTAESSTYNATRVFYQGGLNYQSVQSGNYLPIYRLDFTNVNWTLDSNTLYDFAVGATPIGSNVFTIHATNFPTSGVFGPGADNTYIFYEHDPPSNSSAPYIETFAGTTVPGFSKGADVNVGIDLIQAVPEPQTLTLFVIGLGGIFLGIRRRQRQ